MSMSIQTENPDCVKIATYKSLKNQITYDS